MHRPPSDIEPARNLVPVEHREHTNTTMTTTMTTTTTGQCCCRQENLLVASPFPSSSYHNNDDDDGGTATGTGTTTTDTAKITTSHDHANHPHQWLLRLVPRLVVLLVVVGVVVVALVHYRLLDHLPDVLAYIEGHALGVGVVVYVCAFTVVSMVGVPVSVLTMGGGFIFRPFPLAILVSLVSIFVGATVQFLLGRYLLDDMIRR